MKGFMPLGLALFFLACTPAFAESIISVKRVQQDLGGADQEQAVDSYIQRFVKFTQNKDVMGKPKDPNGKNKPGGPKRSFNPDDGAPFQSEF